jgi:hypothetical protein
MSVRNTNRVAPPQKLFEIYKKIINSKLIKNKELSIDNISEFEHLLNEAQPQNEDDENCMRCFVQYLYRKNPGHFARFINRSRLNQLTLSTESKYMVKAFELRGLVYIKWDIENNKYACSLHKTVSEYMNSGDFSSMEEVANQITREINDKDQSTYVNHHDSRVNHHDSHEFNYRREDNRSNHGRNYIRQNSSSYRDHNHPRMYKNNRSRESHTNSMPQLPTENDFPVLNNKTIIDQPVEWVKKEFIEPTTASVSPSGIKLNNSLDIADTTVIMEH